MTEKPPLSDEKVLRNRIWSLLSEILKKEQSHGPRWVLLEDLFIKHGPEMPELPGLFRELWAGGGTGVDAIHAVLIRALRPRRRELFYPEDLAAFDAFPSGLTIYRGCGDNVSTMGRSWTLSEEQAIWFAATRSVPPNRVILSRRIKKSAVLFYTNEIKEQEVVLLRRAGIRGSVVRRFSTDEAEASIARRVKEWEYGKP